MLSFMKRWIVACAFLSIMTGLLTLEYSSSAFGLSKPMVNNSWVDNTSFGPKIWLANYSVNNPTAAIVMDYDISITQSLLGNGSVVANAASKFNNEIAYYLTSNKEVWRTLDGGQTFQLTGFSSPTEGRVSDIFVDTNPNNVYVLVDYGDQTPQCNSTTDWVRVYRSFDAGNTWLYSQVVDTDANGEEFCLRQGYRGGAFGSTLYMSGRGEGSGGYWDGVIYASYDHGATWTRNWTHDTLTGPNTFSAISSLARSQNIWYAGVEAGTSFPAARPFLRGILRGTGGGWVYKPIEGCAGCFSGDQTVKVVDLTVDNFNPNLVMVLVYGHGLYRSDTGGDSWTRVIASSQVNYGWHIEADPFKSGHFWLVGRDSSGLPGLYYNAGECGSTWFRVYDGPVLSINPISALALSTSYETIAGDTDGDGLYNDWELYGYNPDGDCIVDVDLPAMGADPLHKDLFVELDYMMQNCCLHRSYRLKASAIDGVIAAFANAPVSNPDSSTGITLHIDNGHNSIMNPVTGQIWGSLSESNQIPFSEYFPPPEDVSFRIHKAVYFDLDREQIFRYGISAHLVTDPILWSRCAPLAHGIANGSNIVMYFGSYSSGPSSFEQSVVLMHELGHTFGLRHGGSTSVNGKPNYLSIMNYTFALNGGLIINGAGGYLDFSRFSTANLPNLDENNLDENLGIGMSGYGTFYYTDFDPEYQCLWLQGTVWRNAASPVKVNNASGAIDWNGSGVIESGIQANINGDLGFGPLIPPTPPPIKCITF